MYVYNIYTLLNDWMFIRTMDVIVWQLALLRAKIILRLRSRWALIAIKPYTSSGHRSSSAIAATLKEKICKVPVGPA